MSSIPLVPGAAQDRRRRAQQAPRPADVAQDGGTDQAAQLRRLPGVPEPRHGGDGVDDQADGDPGQQRREDAGHVDHAVPGVARRWRRAAPRRWPGRGSDAASSVTRRPPIECPTQHGLLDAEVVEHAAEQLGVAGHALRAGGQPEGAAVAGGVDGDDLEAEVDEARQGLGVEDPLGGEAVHDHERHAPAADRHPDLVAVGQRDRVAGQTGQGDLDVVVEVRPRSDDRVRGKREVAHQAVLGRGRAVGLVADLDRFPALIRRHRASLADPRGRS